MQEMIEWCEHCRHKVCSSKHERINLTVFVLFGIFVSLTFIIGWNVYQSFLFHFNVWSASVFPEKRTKRRQCCRKRRQGPRRPRRQQQRWWALPLGRAQVSKEIHSSEDFKDLIFKQEENLTCAFKESPPGPSSATFSWQLEDFFLYPVWLSWRCGALSLFVLCHNLTGKISVSHLIIWAAIKFWWPVEEPPWFQSRPRLAQCLFFLPPSSHLLHLDCCLFWHPLLGRCCSCSSNTRSWFSRWLQGKGWPDSRSARCRSSSCQRWGAAPLSCLWRLWSSPAWWSGRGVRSDAQFSCTDTRFQKCSQSGKNGSKHPMLSISMAYNVISCKIINH